MAGPTVTLTFAGDAKKLQSTVAQVEKSTSSFGDRMKKANRVAVASSAAVLGGAIAMGKGLLEAGRAGAKQERILNQAFKSMGGTGSRTFKTIGEQTDRLSEKLARQGDDINVVQTKLATFGKVWEDPVKGAQNFERATELAFDLEAAGFGSAENNIVQLGKALQDPIKGINALARSGVSFTEQEKDKIKALVESGETLEAQEWIYRALERQVGGTAAAGVDGGDRMTASWENLQDKLGRLLIPAMEAVTGLVSGLVGWMSQNETAVKVVAISVVGLAAAILTINGLIKVWRALTVAVTAAQWLLNTALKASPFWRIVTVIGLIAAGLVTLWNRSQTFRTIVTGVFSAVSTAVGWVIDKVSTLIGWIQDAIDWIGQLNTTRVEGKDLGIGFGTGLGAALGIPGLAHGGPVKAGRTYLVGENGPELFTSSGSGRIIPNDDLGNGGGGSSTPRTVMLRSDGSAFSDLIMSTLRNAVRREGGNVQIVLGQG